MNYKTIGENVRSDYLNQIFKNRGMDPQMMMRFLNTSDADIQTYNDLDNIDAAVDMFMRHIDNLDEIFLLVDPDVDGFTSSATLYNFIKELEPQINIKYYFHEGKQHGLNDIDLNVVKKYKFVILPDASSNDYELHKELRDAGIDVLVIDHHHAEKYSEDAVVVNNQLSERYENKSLSGAGVVWQFIRAVIEKRNLHIDPFRFLDLVALGNVADVMDLRSIETKHIVTRGVKNLQNPMLKYFTAVEEFSIGKQLSAMACAWYIAPSMNAVSRVGTIDEKRMLFESMLEDRCSELVESEKRGHKGELVPQYEETVRKIKLIKSKQDKIVEEGLQYIEKLIEKEHLLDNKILTVIIPDGVLPPEVTGLVANKLSPKYQKPTLVLRELEDRYAGSGRNFEGSPIKDFRKALEDSELVIFAQGHQSAFGSSIKKENLTRLNEYFNKLFEEIDSTIYNMVDFAFDYQTEKTALYDCVQVLGSLGSQKIYGQGFFEPKIIINNVPVSTNIVQMGKDKKTLKITCGNLPFLRFKSKDGEYEKLYGGFGEKLITVLGTCNLNEWQGRVTPQIFINDYEIKETKKWSF